MEYNDDETSKSWRDWMPLVGMTLGVLAAETARKRFNVANSAVKRFGFDAALAAGVVVVTEAALDTFEVGYPPADKDLIRERKRLIRAGIPSEKLSHHGKTAMELLGLLQRLSDTGGNQDLHWLQLQAQNDPLDFIEPAV